MRPLKQLKRVARAVVGSKLAQKAIRPHVIGEPNVASQYMAFDAPAESYCLPGTNGRLERADDGLPIPPRELWLGYGESASEYLGSGGIHVDQMFEFLQSADAVPDPGARLLDFGCGAGRMTRHVSGRTSESEVWGVDISARHVFWCQQHLSPPMRFFVNTTAPHLPFEDGSFDLIFSRSVFTHIGPELADGWLLELRRILRPGGSLWATVLDDDAVAILRDNPVFRTVKTARQLERARSRFGFEDSGYAFVALSRWDVIYDSAFLYRKLEGLFEDVRRRPAELGGLTPEEQGMRGHQTAVLLRKSAGPAATRIA